MILETGYVARTRTVTIADIFVHSELATGVLLPIDYESYPLLKA